MVYVTHERRVIRNVPLELWRRVRILAVNREWTVSKLVIEAIWITWNERIRREGNEVHRSTAFFSAAHGRATCRFR